MTLLYADDDEEDQEVFAEIIQAIDPQITILRAQDGLGTLEILSRSEAPNIIFLDFNMPFLNGNELLAEIRKDAKYNNTRVIIFSTNLYKRPFDECASVNVQYARKPNTFQEGVEAIRAIIQEASAG